MGLSVYLCRNGKEFSLPSKDYPDHMFQIGFFRSPYNDHGLNTVLADRGIPTLYHIFDHTPDQNIEQKPDWKLARKKTLSVIKQLRKSFNELPYEIRSMLIKDEPQLTRQKIMATLKYEKENSSKMFSIYTTKDGLFSLKKPLPVVAIFQAKGTFSNNRIYIVSEMSEKQKNFYIQALLIVLETIEYVLSDDPKIYTLIWSG